MSTGRLGGRPLALWLLMPAGGNRVPTTDVSTYDDALVAGVETTFNQWGARASKPNRAPSAR
jgi:hypothetical protein